MTGDPAPVQARGFWPGSRHSLTPTWSPTTGGTCDGHSVLPRSHLWPPATGVSRERPPASETAQESQHRGAAFILGYERECGFVWVHTAAWVSGRHPLPWSLPPGSPRSWPRPPAHSGWYLPACLLSLSGPLVGGSRGS